MLRARDADSAAVMKQRLAFVYAIVGWNTAMYVFYQVYVGEGGIANERETILERAIEQNENVELITLTGLNVNDVKRERLSKAK